MRDISGQAWEGWAAAAAAAVMQMQRRQWQVLGGSRGRGAMMEGCCLVGLLLPLVALLFVVACLTYFSSVFLSLSLPAFPSGPIHSLLFLKMPSFILINSFITTCHTLFYFHVFQFFFFPLLLAKLTRNSLFLLLQEILIHLWHSPQWQTCAVKQMNKNLKIDEF